MSGFFVGKDLGKMGDKMGGGERRLLPIAFLPVFPFIIDIFVRLRRSFPSSTRLFIHAMWVIPGYDFMDDNFNINVNITANILQFMFFVVIYTSFMCFYLSECEIVFS